MTAPKPVSVLCDWKPSGRISLWRYAGNTRHYPGWHLNADAAGCRSLIDLLDALATEYGRYRTVPLLPPGAAQLRVPDNRRSACIAATKLQWMLSDATTLWRFPPDGDPAVLTVGSDWLAPLRRGLHDIARGRGDYCIGGDRNGNLPLWFWWGS
ncbi:hypothetical protein [Tahibacter caeni]|uniref:hypothetical protein n=1 Tax=Tahibacter caeni TaxID=1453545 RepID=UPI002147826E|nr:hypothetical protein [Tahibacter caeni]